MFFGITLRYVTASHCTTVFLAHGDFSRCKHVKLILGDDPESLLRSTTWVTSEMGADVLHNAAHGSEVVSHVDFWS